MTWLFTFFVVSSAGLWAQYVPVPAPVQTRPVLLSGATAHLGNGQVIENSLVAFEGGKITVVADAKVKRAFPDHLVVDASGKHLYPGFIAPNTTLGLTEIDGVRATQDNSELGEMNPNILRRITIGEMTRGMYGQTAIVPNDLPFARVEAHLHETGESDLVLRDQAGRLAGLVALSDLGEGEDLEELGALVVAHDLVNRRTISLTPKDHLIRALEVFGDREFDKIPIVDPQQSDQLLGYVTFSAILDFYKREHAPADIATVTPV